MGAEPTNVAESAEGDNDEAASWREHLRRRQRAPARALEASLVAIAQQSSSRSAEQRRGSKFSNDSGRAGRVEGR